MRELCSSGQHVHGEVMCCIYTLWETLFPIIKTPTPTVKYGGHCLRYRHTLVGKNYLLLVYIMEDTAPDNAVRIRCVHGPRDRRWSDLRSFPIKLNKLVLCQKGPIQCQFIKGKGKKRKKKKKAVRFWGCPIVLSSAPAVSQHAHFF